MGERENYAPGTFCWAELGTTDADAAKAFYTGVFGWEAVDAPAGEAGTYTTFKLDGQDVGGAVRDGGGGARFVDAALVLVRLGRGRRLPGSARFGARRRGARPPVRRHAVRPHDRAEGPDRRDRAPVAAAVTGRRRRASTTPAAWSGTSWRRPTPPARATSSPSCSGWELEPRRSGYGIIKNKGALNGGMRPRRTASRPTGSSTSPPRRSTGRSRRSARPAVR